MEAKTTTNSTQADDPGRLEIQPIQHGSHEPAEFNLVNSDGFYIATIHDGVPGSDSRATAERMQAAWNACQGTPTDWLKAWSNPLLGRPSTISGAFQSMIARADTRRDALRGLLEAATVIEAQIKTAIESHGPIDKAQASQWLGMLSPATTCAKAGEL